MGQVIQSFKKVLNFALTSRGAGAIIAFPVSIGQDSVAAGQTGVTDPNVPTGSIIKYFEITYTDVNLVAVSHTINWTIQQLHSGQSRIDPRVVGGNPQRNQVFAQGLFSVGRDQNSTHIMKFKVPPKFQRVREGDTWDFAIVGLAVHADSCQIIYKFYR